MPEAARSLKRTVTINSLFSVAAWLTPLVVGFLATPILVQGLGAARYGLFALISGFIGYSFAFSIGRLVVRYVAEYAVANDSNGINKVISAAFLISTAVGILGAIVLSLSTPYIVTEVLRIEPELRTTAEYAFYLANATVFLTMIGQVFQYVLHGFQQFGRFVVLSNLYSLLLGAGNIFLVRNDFSVIGLFAWSLLLSALLAIGYYLAVKRIFPDLNLTVSIPRETWSAATHYATSIILYQIFGNLLFIFERSWITRYFGTSPTGYFAVAAQVGIYAQTLAASIAAVFLPVMSEAIRDSLSLQSIYARATKILLVALAFFCVAIIFLGKSFLALWINAEFASKASKLLIIQGFSYALIALMVVVWQLNEAARAPGINAITAGIWLIVAVAVTVATTNWLGVESAPIGRLLGVVVTIPVIFFAEKRFLGRIQHKFWTGTLLRLLPPVFILSVVFYVADQFISIKGSLHLIVVGSFGAIMYGGLVILTGVFTKSELKDFPLLRRIF